MRRYMIGNGTFLELSRQSNRSNRSRIKSTCSDTSRQEAGGSYESHLWQFDLEGRGQRPARLATYVLFLCTWNEVDTETERFTMQVGCGLVVEEVTSSATPSFPEADDSRTDCEQARRRQHHPSLSRLAALHICSPSRRPLAIMIGARKTHPT